MARIYEPTKGQLRAWAKWVRERPASVREVAQRFNPWTLYRVKSTGQRVVISSFQETKDGAVTITVEVSGQYNAVMFDREVFGYGPDDLEECDLPAADAVIGTLLSPEQVDDNIDLMRVLVRPDLWVLDLHGKAVRKQ